METEKYCEIGLPKSKLFVIPIVVQLKGIKIKNPPALEILQIYLNKSKSIL